MRIFMPMEMQELLAPAPPRREGHAATRAAGLKGEELELALEEVLDSAAYTSLGMTLEGAGVPRRLVAVGERLDSWDQVEAFYVDDAETSQLIERAREATSQDELDLLADSICATPMDWYDGSELDDLRALAEA